MPDAQRSAASGVQFGRLERGEDAGLCQGVDPDGVEPRQILRQPADACCHPRHVIARGYAQAFQRGNKFVRRPFGHRRHPYKVNSESWAFSAVFHSAPNGVMMAVQFDTVFSPTATSSAIQESSDSACRARK